MQRAQLHAHDQHLGGRIGPHDVAGEPQGGDRRVAAHEADHRALDRGVEAAAPHQLEVDPGRREPGAGRDDQMRHVARGFAEAEPIDRGGGKLRRLDLVSAHALGRRGQVPQRVEAVRVDRFVAARSSRREARPAPRDLRARHHALEQEARAPVAQEPRREAHEGPVDLVCGGRCRDAVEVRPGHRLRSVRDDARVKAITRRARTQLTNATVYDADVSFQISDL